MMYTIFLWEKIGIYVNEIGKYANLNIVLWTSNIQFDHRFYYRGRRTVHIV